MDDDSIIEARVAGRTVRQIARSKRTTADRINRVIDRWSDQAIHQHVRKHALAVELERLDRLTAVFQQKALEGDATSGALVLKIIERRGVLLGLHVPQRHTLEVIDARIPRPSTTDKLEAALTALIEDRTGDRQPPPDQKDEEPTQH